MKMSRRAKRMARAHKRHKTPALNLVSLMDIFTILVFFLLVSSSNSYQLPSTKDLTLPSSSSQNPPEETLVIAVTRTEILIEGQKVADVSESLKNPDAELVALKNELGFYRTQNNATAEAKKITIMSDEDAPYAILKKILATCQAQNYTRIAFAAMQQEKHPGK